MSNAEESALHYRFGDTLPEPGTTLEVAPGVRWLRMGLPFALDHINLWLLRDCIEGVEGWTIVDCGIADDATRANWSRIFDSGDLQGLPVLRLIVTHMHPDHIGLAHWLCESHDLRLWISATDYNVARIGSESTSGFGRDSAAHFCARHGLVDPQALEQVRQRGGHYVNMVPAVPRSFRRLMDGMPVRIGTRTWHCIAGYGHAPEHIALHAPSTPDGGGSLLISGDMVLPRISTNVSVGDMEPEADPLPLYLASIERFRALPADTLVLPSHGKPFTGLHTRIDQLQAHHQARFAEVLAACADAPLSAADLLPVLFKRKLDPQQTPFAMGESVAHVHALAGMGKVTAVQGDDGVLRWRTLQVARSEG
ncbi:MAG: MBL fold metallo-hydrolase [Rubrivivax sp.]